MTRVATLPNTLPELAADTLVTDLNVSSQSVNPKLFTIREKIRSISIQHLYFICTTAATLASLASCAKEVDSRRSNHITTSSLLDIAETMIDVMFGSRYHALILMHTYLMILYVTFVATMTKCFRHIRPTESQQTKEAILHFSLMRCLVLATTLGPLTGFLQLGILLLWLSSVAFMRGVVTMCKCRFDYLMTRPIPNEVDIYRLSWVLTATIVVNLALVFVWSSSTHFSYLTIHFAYFEASLLLLKATQLGVKIIYSIFDLDTSFHESHIKGRKVSKCSSLAKFKSLGMSSLTALKILNLDGLWCMFKCDKGEFYLLVTQMGLSGCYLLQLIVYYLYILGTDQFRISFLDLILILNVKNAMMEVVDRYKKISIYKHAAMELDELFPSANDEDLAANLDDVCVICLKPMSLEAKKLRCGHLLHKFCLRQCLQKESADETFTHSNLMGQRHHNNLKTNMRCPLCRQNIHFSTEFDTACALTNVNSTLVQPPEELRANRAEPLALPPAEEVIRFSSKFSLIVLLDMFIHTCAVYS
ncbi:hypothetical protein ABG067_002842 [Albugo candida]